MKDPVVPIHFYFPHESYSRFHHIEDLSEGELWELLIGHPVGKTGVAHWVLQTYYYLRKAGWTCALVNEVPPEGILLTHRDFLPVPVKDTRLIASRKLTVVSLKVDRGMYHPADFNVVHNPQDADFRAGKIYIPPWPQIALSPRQSAPGLPPRTIGFVGNPAQLDPYFTGNRWQGFLQKHGLRWIVKSPQEWNEYADIDLLIGIRSFDKIASDLAKPPLKLINAWQAGVPLVVTPESAYTAYRTDPLDFKEVRTPEELESFIASLVREPSIYGRYVDRAVTNRPRVSIEAVLARWETVLRDVILPHHQTKPWSFIATRRLKALGVSGKRRLQALIGK